MSDTENSREIQVRSPKANVVAGRKPLAIVPTSLDEAWRLSEAIHMAGMQPREIDSVAKIMVIVLHGLEIGIAPMQALQRISLINNRPSLWGDAAIGLVRASGLCDYVHESIDGTGDNRVAICIAKRKDQEKPITGKFSVADARRARLWDTREVAKRKNYKTQEFYDAPNDSPWYRFPERMLQMRARGLCLRDGFADVLGGFYLREELEETEAEPVRQIPQQAVEPEKEKEQPRESVKASSRAPRPPEPSTENKPTTTTVLDHEALRKRWMDFAATAESVEELAEGWEQIVRPHEDDLFPLDKDELLSNYRKREHELAT